MLRFDASDFFEVLFNDTHYMPLLLIAKQERATPWFIAMASWHY